jgi:hypothetical protein
MTIIDILKSVVEDENIELIESIITSKTPIVSSMIEGSDNNNYIITPSDEILDKFESFKQASFLVYKALNSVGLDIHEVNKTLQVGGRFYFNDLLNNKLFLELINSTKEKFQKQIEFLGSNMTRSVVDIYTEIIKITQHYQFANAGEGEPRRVFKYSLTPKPVLDLADTMEIESHTGKKYTYYLPTKQAVNKLVELKKDDPVVSKKVFKDMKQRNTIYNKIKLMDIITQGDKDDKWNA